MLLQEPALYDGSAIGGGYQPGGSHGSGVGFTAPFRYPNLPQPGPMPAGHGAIRTLAGPQGPQGPHDAFTPFAGVVPLSSTDSSPDGSRTAGKLRHCSSAQFAPSRFNMLCSSIMYHTLFGFQQSLNGPCL